MAKITTETVNNVLNPLLQEGESYNAKVYTLIQPKNPAMQYFGLLGALLGGAKRVAFVGLTSEKLKIAIVDGWNPEKTTEVKFINLNEITKIKFKGAIGAKCVTIYVGKEKTELFINNKIKTIPEQTAGQQTILDRMHLLADRLKK